MNHDVLRTTLTIEVEIPRKSWLGLFKNFDIFGSSYCGYWLRGIEYDDALGWLVWESLEKCPRGEEPNLKEAREAWLATPTYVDADRVDGRPFTEYRADPLAGICDAPEARARAIAAWGKHQWSDCPMHAAHGYNDVNDAPEDSRKLVACFVALFDAKLLPKPEGG